MAVYAVVCGIRSARPSGFGALVADRVSVTVAVNWIAVVLGFGAAVAVALCWILGPQLIALATAWLVRRHAAQRFGGITGDVFGALVELATAVTLIGVAIQ